MGVNAAMGQTVVTSVTALASALVGGWLAMRGHDRAARRDDARHHRDLRLGYYEAFVTAFRGYIAHLQLPDTTVTAVRRARPPHDLMPQFDAAGSAYSRRLDATKTAVRLITSNTNLIAASRLMVHAARCLAVDRATTPADATAAELYEQLWDAERKFLILARKDLGITNTTPRSWCRSTRQQST